METVSDPVSSDPALAQDHPPVPAPSHRGEPTRPAAVPVQPVNAPIEQTVGSSNVSSSVPASSSASTAAAAIAAGKPREVFIQGITSNGRQFRPSDWAERLAGAMSSFRPGGARGGPGAHIGYSPYCFPTTLAGVKCVVVNEALRKLEPMAWDFVMNFAKDNDLQLFDGCILPD
ncbi:DUF3579 domain-containing protein [Aquabacterium soli]|uniref:DUF3579 domain-containing protein n=1 Tax=Aquabacterium soli TaxID=2493092 RepID=A0A3R8TUP9_9BURK|nr:DUF3579 domain-containing protein [Aquabacterium soli]